MTEAQLGDICDQLKLKFNIEVWLSLVERYVRDVEVASSNLVTSTIKAKMRGNASHFCFDSGYSNLSWFAKQTQVRIRRSEIDTLACQA